MAEVSQDRFHYSSLHIIINDIGLCFSCTVKKVVYNDHPRDQQYMWSLDTGGLYMQVQ